jgi:hypothetical protein
MWDLVKLLSGKKHCPWCNISGEYSAYERFMNLITDKLPKVAVMHILGPYDRLVGKIGTPLHIRLHISKEALEEYYR